MPDIKHMMSLADRFQGNMHIELFWNPTNQQCYVEVYDEMGEFEPLIKRVPNDKALEAYNRPFEFCGWPDKKKRHPATV
jgi:hypothetical protein